MKINVRSLTPNMTKYLAFGPLYSYLKVYHKSYKYILLVVITGHLFIYIDTIYTLTWSWVKMKDELVRRDKGMYEAV